MACTPSPTATLFGSSEVVSNSVSQSTSTVISTLPPSTITTTSTSCADPSVSASGTCTSQVTVTLTSTIPGATTTLTDHVPVTIPVTLTSTFPTETLFSTCPSSQPSQPPPNTDSNTSASPTSSDSPSMFTSASQSTLPDGQVSTTFVIFYSSAPTQTVTIPPSPGLNNSGNNNTMGNSNLGPIVGGVLGGFFGLLLFAGAFICWRRRRRWDDIYEKGSNHGVDDDDRPIQAPEPAPYHYGLVGHHRNPSASPPSSPTSRPTTFHSRVESSGATSVVSRESSVPLTLGDTVAAGSAVQNRPHAHSRSTSQASDGLLMMRPLELASQGDALPNLGRKTNYNNPPGSPSSPRQTFLPLRVTNADEMEAGPSHTGPGIVSRRDSSRSPVLVHVDGGRLAGGSGVEQTGTPDENPPAYSKTG